MMNTVVSTIPTTDEGGLGGVQLVICRLAVGVPFSHLDCVSTGIGQ
jgi:hypothetical protein